MSEIGDMWNACGEACAAAGGPLDLSESPSIEHIVLSAMSEARHFELPRSMSDKGAKERIEYGGVEDAISTWDEFRFPFNVIAVSDRHNKEAGPGITIVGSIGDALGTQQGLSQPLAVGSISDTAPHGYMMSWCRLNAERSGDRIGVRQISALKVMFVDGATRRMVSDDVAARMREVVSVETEVESGDKAPVALRLLADAFLEALELMAIVQRPKSFIVEMSPTCKRKRPSKKRPAVPRLSERPIYVGMTSHEIRSSFALPTGRKVADHDVRAHYRVLRSDRYIKKQGQRIFVKAHFSAPSEGRSPDGRRYKVLLDIPGRDQARPEFEAKTP